MARNSEEIRILSTCMSPTFQTLRENSFIMSHHKYGEPKDNYGRDTCPNSALKNLKAQIEYYETTGNLDGLVNVANYAELEFQYPSVPNAHLDRRNEHGQPRYLGVPWAEIEKYGEDEKDV
jgi:hypothetical protein